MCADKNYTVLSSIILTITLTLVSLQNISLSLAQGVAEISGTISAKSCLFTSFTGTPVDVCKSIVSWTSNSATACVYANGNLFACGMSGSQKATWIHSAGVADELSPENSIAGFFNVQTGETGWALTGNANHFIPSLSAIPVKDGWYLCTLSGVVTVSNSSKVSALNRIADSNDYNGFHGDGKSSILLWGGQLQANSP